MAERPVVGTRHGRLRGEDLGGVLAFLGIPYAAAPDAPELARFGPPIVPPSWRGVREATAFGPVAPQRPAVPGSYLPGDPHEQDEECRTLNVWTPGCDDRRRPVLVFVHGGAFLNGSGASLLYRGEHLARAGVVVVTFNYRLGALGFLAHPALAHRALDGGCGNHGLADQLAALAYVRQHAAAFGGDPENVTVFGESAGAMSVCDLIGMPAARGLFRRAIVESGCAVARPLELAAPLAEELSTRIDEGMGIPFGPAVDGGLVEVHPADVIAAGAGSPETELLAGTNRDEFTLFSFVSPLARELDDERLVDLVGRYLAGAGLASPPAAAEVVDCYRRARAGRGEGTAAKELLDAFGTDWVFRVPLVRMLDAHARHGAAAYAYRFDWTSPFAGGVLGACHGLELPFVFGTLGEPVVGLFAGTGEQAERLSEQMRAAWIAFASAGDPSCEALGPWPAYRPDRRRTMVLGPEPRVEEAPGEEERRFWELRLGRYGVLGPSEGARARSLAFLGEPPAHPKPAVAPEPPAGT